MANFYTGRRALKRAASINGVDRDAIIDRIIEAASRRIDRATRRFFIPRTETRLFRWPPEQHSRGYILWLDQDLISVTTLQTKAQDSSPTTISSSDYFTEPNNTGPPYNRIEIDLSSDAALEAGDTPQRSISVAGSWGFANDTRSAGTVASGLDSDATATSFVASDSSLLDVGDTMLVESEQIFISNVASAARGSILINDTLTADVSDVTVTVDGSHGLVAGEVILIDSERMFIESISTNDLTVVRAYDGSVLATHSDDTAVHVFRTYTIERGVNGTTAATHADATAISVYEPPFDITQLCLADAIAAYHQEAAGWGRQVGAGEGATQPETGSLNRLRKDTIARYQRVRSAAI